MTVAHDLIIDQFTPTVDGDKHLATWYAQGHSDGLGDRLLMFDNTSAPSWEILRFRPALAHDVRFEAALRERVEQLGPFRHPAFPLVRPIKGLAHDDGLAVVSTYASGVRLSEALKKPRSAAFAVRLIHQLVPALTALQQQGPGIVHGALDVDRIVVTAESRLVIRDHMVGSALESLGLSAARLWADFGIIASPTSTTAPALDSRSDVVQLGLVALSLMAGRRVGPDDYPEKIDELLDEIADRTDQHAPATFQPLRRWLERALQLDGAMFGSAQDASEGLAELWDEPERGDDYLGSLDTSLQQGSDTIDSLGNAAGRRPMRRGPHLIVSKHLEAAEEPLESPAPLVVDSPVGEDNRTQPTTEPVPPVDRRVGRTIRWTAAAVTVLAVVEAAFIGRLLYKRSPSASAATVPVVIESARPAVKMMQEDLPVGLTPLQANVPKAPEISTTLQQKATPVKAEGRPAGALPAPALSQRSGGFRLSSPVEVHVLDGERVLGSSKDGPIVVSAGRHELEFVNSAIGYRVRRVVDVKAGQVTRLSITLPNSSVNINAVPWASVWIDGNALGETPLGNISVAPGEHEIVFRHPQLGERREKTIVRADGLTRVTVNLQR